jgi:Uma2 family endonuclease
MSGALKIPSVLTVAEFLAWNAPPNARWQLVEGVPTAMAPPSRTHGMIQAELGLLIGLHLRERGSPCRVVTTPGLVPRIRSEGNFRIPDLAVTCAPYQQEEYDLADPVLVIEILSPSNRSETWLNVWAYATIPSVREIVIVDSTAIAVEVLRRGDNGDWPAHAERVTEGTVRLASVGFTTPIDAIYRGTRLLPSPGTGASA